MAITITRLLTGVLKEIRVARAGDVPSPDDMDDVLQIFNEVLDEWNADRRAAYNLTFTDFTLVPNLSPHTIGPAASGPAGANPTFVVVQRPVTLEAAQLNMGGSPAVFRGINVRDDAWYQQQPMPGLTQSVPTDVYYSDDWTDPTNLGSGYGALYFFGVPNTAYGVRLWMRVLLAQVTDLTLNLSLPQGYQAALRLTVSERAAAWFGQVVAPSTAEAARIARERVFGNNDPVPSIATADAGLRMGGSQPNGFNWMNRSFS